MNVYVRYFDHEEVFKHGEDAVKFLVEINDFNMTQNIENDILNYCSGNMPYPMRIKVRSNVYFILIKTTAETLAEFKANRKNPQASAARSESSKKEEILSQLREPRKGWYIGEINFKRVSYIPGTQKCQYHDTRFKAYVYADSAMNCYDLLIEHLRNRQDVDPRSQFPSARGANYIYDFLGDNIQP